MVNNIHPLLLQKNAIILHEARDSINISDLSWKNKEERKKRNTSHIIISIAYASSESQIEGKISIAQLHFECMFMLMVYSLWGVSHSLMIKLWSECLFPGAHLHFFCRVGAVLEKGRYQNCVKKWPQFAYKMAIIENSLKKVHNGKYSQKGQHFLLQNDIIEKLAPI